MTAARAARPDLEAGCVLARETGVLVILTDDGTVRATYGARMLAVIGRDRSRVPDPGDWVTVRRWCDGPVTVEDTLTRPSRPLAQVLPLRGSRRAAGAEDRLGD
ncbi:MAG: hypothetical protein ABIR34_13485 [Marmoricola sp.]